VALKQIGDVRFNQGKLEPALKAFQQALVQSEALYKTDPKNNDYLFELGQAEFWVGYVAWERGDLEQAAVYMQRYMQYSKQLSERAPDNADYRLELSYAHNNLGSIALAQGNPESALEQFIFSVAIAQKMLAQDPDNVDSALNLAENLSWTAATYSELNQLVNSSQTYQKSIDVLQPFHIANKDRRVNATIARQMVMKADVDMMVGVAGVDLINQARSIYANLLQIDPSNSIWLYDSLKAEYLRLSIMQPGARTSADRQSLELAQLQFEKLLETNATNTDYSRYLASVQQLRIIDLIAQGNSDAALRLAEDSWVQWQKAIKGKPLTSELNLTEAMLEESLGVAYAATGQRDTAIDHWRHAAEKIEAMKRKNLSMLAVRRLLALNLGQNEQAEKIQKQLLQAGFKDSRMQPEYTLSGTFE
jgi:tetratricopeptide (TPR) repeat protein